MDTRSPDDVPGTERNTVEANAGRAGRAPSEWSEEQLRYCVLLTVYAETEACCDREVAGNAIGAALDLRCEDLYRVIHFLEYNGYLDYRGAGPRVCLTRKGIDYVRQIARRRHSIRTSGSHLRGSGNFEL